MGIDRAAKDSVGKRERLSRVLKRARDFYSTYTSGLQAGDFRRLFTEETRGIHRFFGQEAEEADKGGRFARAMRGISRIFWGFVLAMSPARRILYGVAFIIFAVSLLVIITAPSGSEIREDVAVLSVYTFIITTFLLALELADKLSARDEIEIARDVQMSLLPPRNPVLPGLEVANYSAPAADVGGDYHDFVLADGRVCLAIGDVSGHGLAAGLVMAMAKSALQAQALNDPSPPAVLRTLNKVVRDASDSRTLMTFLYCVLDPESGGLTYANAGHIAPILKRADSGAAQWLDAGEYPLGVREKREFRCSGVRLRKGDLLFLVSDGVVETVNEEGESYGYDRLLRCVAGLPDEPPGQLLELLLRDLAAFAGERSPRLDDQTVIVVRFTGI